MSKKTHNLFGILFVLSAILIFTGIAMLYSASTVESYNNFGNTNYYFYHQLMYGGGIGFVLSLVAFFVPLDLWRKLAPINIVLAIVSLGLVFVPALSFSHGGATRWLHFGEVIIQPVEIAKLALAAYLASWLSTKQIKEKQTLRSLFPLILVMVLLSGLVLAQPDVGSLLVLVALFGSMLFFSGVSKKLMFKMLLAVTVALSVIVVIEPYRAARLTTFLQPDHDRLGVGYQVNQSQIAIGSGKLFGYGYGLSRQKHNYLPETVGDSIFAVVAEELGFIRVVLLLFLFSLIVFLGSVSALGHPTPFGKLFGLGLTTNLAVQVIINIGAMVSIIPLTGIPLPFFSYGSSSYIINIVSLALMLKIASRRN